MSKHDNSIHPVFPSILSTNFFNLEEKLTVFRANGINHIHLDVMDGHFVDNISFGPSACKSIKSAFDFKIDAHLMVANPGKMIPRFIAAGADWVSFHMETKEDVAENIQSIKREGKKAGLVLNPDTPVEKVFPYLDDIDFVLLMSVFPGFGGQSFIPDTVSRTETLANEIKFRGTQCLIQVDGGINAGNIPQLVRAGAQLFVIGTFLFNSQDIPGVLEKVMNAYEGK